jgi:uncharacterized protein (DUF2249 family)
VLHWRRLAGDAAKTGQPRPPARLTAKEKMEMTASSDTKTLDVRTLPPAQRHPLIFGTFHDLAPGESFVLINDHDPKPLYYQFKFEYEGQFSWEYLEQGPEAWRVRIGRVVAAPA